MNYPEQQEPVTTRGAYHRLDHAPGWVYELEDEAASAAGWEIGIESDHRMRGTAVNTDIYGYDGSQGLAVIQVRETVFRPGRFSRVRKNYFLIGRNENGSAFAHCVPSPLRSKVALQTPESTVAWVLSKIWKVPMSDLGEVERQGDVAFIPVSRIPKGAERLEGVHEVLLAESHSLRAREIYQGANGALFVRRGARLVHTKRQHRCVRAKAGLYRVVVGYREKAWNFSLESHD